MLFLKSNKINELQFNQNLVFAPFCYLAKVLIDGGINFEYFSVHLLKDEAVETLRVPMWSPEQSVRAFLEIVWDNLFMLCEDFTATLISARLRPEFAFFHDHPTMGSPESPWKVTSREQMERNISKPGWKKG